MPEITPARAAELIAEALQHSADAMRRTAGGHSLIGPGYAGARAGYRDKAAEFQQLHDTLARTLPGAAGLRSLSGPSVVSPGRNGEPDIDATDLAAEALASQLATDKARYAHTFGRAAAAVLSRADGSYAVTDYPVRESITDALRSVHYPGGQTVRMAPDFSAEPETAEPSSAEPEPVTAAWARAEECPDRASYAEPEAGE